MNDVVLNVHVNVMDKMWKKLQLPLITWSYYNVNAEVRNSIRRDVSHKVWIYPRSEISGTLYDFEFKEL